MFKVAFELKRYFWQKLKLKKTQNMSRATTNKQVSSSILEVGIVAITINNHMVVIQVSIGNNIIVDLLLNGGYRVNIIIEQLRLRLWLPNLNLAP